MAKRDPLWLQKKEGDKQKSGQENALYRTLKTKLSRVHGKVERAGGPHVPSSQKVC